MGDREALIDALRMEPDGTTPRRLARWILPGIALAAGGAISLLFLGRTATSTARAAEEVRPRSVAPAPAALPAGGTFQAAGYVVARRKATIAAEVPGRLTEVEVEEGHRVVAGQVLARLDEADALQKLRISEADLAAAEKTLEEVQAEARAAEQSLRRVENLHRESLISDDTIETARANVARLRAKEDTHRVKIEGSRNTLAITRSYVDDHVIRAPFAGVVIERNAQKGEYMSPQSAGGAFTRTGLCTIVDTSSIEGEVDVNEVYIDRIRSGQPVRATLNAYPGWQIAGRVIAIVPAADRQTATVKVRIKFDQLDDRMLPDMGLRVTFFGGAQS